jgi:type IV secretory pathway VirB10-like protein
MKGRPKEPLSRVYLDDYPITLMGDEATPPLSRIIRAGGKRPDRVDVVYLTSPSDRSGRVVDPETIIDRTAEPTRPIYLRTVPRAIPIRTADRASDLSPPDAPSGPTSRAPMPNVDPVIAQLGGRPPGEAEPPHEEAVFRSPTQLAADAAAALSRQRGAALAKAARIVRAKADQATAEGEAEDRQEDERNQEDTLQDEREDSEDARDDESRP